MLNVISKLIYSYNVTFTFFIKNYVSCNGVLDTTHQKYKVSNAINEWPHTKYKKTAQFQMVDSGLIEGC